MNLQRMARREVRHLAERLERHRGILAQMKRRATPYATRRLVEGTIAQIESELMNARREAVGLRRLPEVASGRMERATVVDRR